MRDIPGVTRRSNDTLHRILGQHLPGAQVVLFGSRAKGTHREGSDIDLAVKNLPEGTQLWRVRAALDESTLPYMVDVVDYDAITNPLLRDEIDQYGIDLTLCHNC